MNGHSNIGPSSAERWLACPGSVALSEKAPKPKPSPYAAEGSAAHLVAEKFVTEEWDEFDAIGRVGTKLAMNGFEVEVTDEMVEGATMYRELLMQDRQTLGAARRNMMAQLLVERKVTLSSVSKDLWGTADAVIYQPGHKLIVYDYKYGKGVAVEAVENPQMAIYALAAMDSFAGDVSTFDSVELVIVQPRASHIEGRIRRWVASRDWLVGFRARLKEAMKAIRKADAPLSAGSHCRWCPAQAICPEIYAATQRGAQSVFSMVPRSESDIAAVAGAVSAIKTVPVAKLAEALKWEDAISAWFSAVKDRIRDELTSGKPVPGWKLVNGRSSRKWADGTGEEAAARFGVVYGTKVFEPQTPLSPAKMEKLVGKGKLGDLVVTIAGELTVAPESDPRPAAATSAQRVFDPIVAPLPAPNSAATATPTGPIWP